MYWPQSPDTPAREAYDECMKYFCCYAQMHPEELLAAAGFTEADIMNQSYIDKSVNLTGLVDICYIKWLNNMTKAEFLEAGCNSVTCEYYFSVRHELQELEFGWGLFRGSSGLQQASDDSEKLSNQRECVGWCFRNRYEFEPTLFLMVSYLVMLVVSFNEVRQALHLLVYAAAAAGALPPFYDPELLQQRQACGFHADLSNGSACFVLFAPILQLLVAFVVMTCGGGLLMLTDQQNNRATIVFSAVALAFIVELDDRIGLIMRMQQPWVPRRDRASPRVAATSSGSTTAAWCKPWVGHAVFGIVGLLLLSHSLLVAPQTPAQIMAFFTTTWAYIGRGLPATGASTLHDWSFDDRWRDGLTYNFLLDPKIRAVDFIDTSTIWNTYALLGFAGLTRLPTDPGGLGLVAVNGPIDRTGAIVMCSMYLLVSVLTVSLLCHSLLPCKAPHWRWALTCVQVVLVIVAQLQHLTGYKSSPEVQSDGGTIWVPSPRNDISADPMEAQSCGFLIVLIMLFVSWLAMFVLWPLLFWARATHRLVPVVAGVKAVPPWIARRAHRFGGFVRKGVSQVDLGSDPPDRADAAPPAQESPDDPADQGDQAVQLDV